MLADDFFVGTKLYHKKFAEFCRPMVDYLGASVAMYVNFDKHGKVFSIHTCQKWIERFLEEQYYKVDPLLVHPSNMHNGFVFEETSTEQEFKDTLLYDVTVNFGVCHNFVYIEKTTDNSGYFGFVFGTEKDNVHMVNRLVNESHIVKKIIRKINKNLISVVKDLPEHRMDFAALKGDAFYTQKGEVFDEAHAESQHKKIAFLKEAGLFTGCNSNQDFLTKIFLSPQEISCLRVYANSHSIKRVARELNLAVSTIKSYIENIKHKLECHTKHDLLEKAAILESLGYL